MSKQFMKQASSSMNQLNTTFWGVTVKTLRKWHCSWYRYQRGLCTYPYVH